MKSLVLLLVMVIFVAVLYQSVFVGKVNDKSKITPKAAPAIKTLQQAKELQGLVNQQADRIKLREERSKR